MVHYEADEHAAQLDEQLTQEFPDAKDPEGHEHAPADKVNPE